MTDNKLTSAKTTYRLTLLRRRRNSLRFGTTWRILVKIAAVCLLAALLVFVYGSQKWWGAPFLLVAAAIAVYLPVACARCSRAIAKLERDGLPRPPASAPSPAGTPKAKL